MTAHSTQEWPPARTLKLRALWALGKSATECARDLNKEFGCALTRNAVLGKADRLGLPSRNHASAVIRRQASRAAAIRWAGGSIKGSAKVYTPGVDPRPDLSKNNTG